MTETQVGTTTSTAPPLPADEHSHLLPAGAVTFGVEYRGLGSDDSGVTIRVCGTDDGYEYLRFDAFAQQPHYHYSRRDADGAVKEKVVAYDAVANGDMLEWTIARLRTRLAEMLTATGGDEVAASLDPPVVDFVLDVVAQKADAARGAHA